jgi:hypothetical protein
MTARAMAPFNGPRRYIMDLNNLSAIPDFPSNVAMRTKLGMAIRILLVVESKVLPRNIYQPSVPQPIRAKIVASPARIKATGCPSASPVRTPANIRTVTISGDISIITVLP